MCRFIAHANSEGADQQAIPRCSLTESLDIVECIFKQRRLSSYGGDAVGSGHSLFAHAAKHYSHDTQHLFETLHRIMCKLLELEYHFFNILCYVTLKSVQCV